MGLGRRKKDKWVFERRKSYYKSDRSNRTAERLVRHSKKNQSKRERLSGKEFLRQEMDDFT